MTDEFLKTIGDIDRYWGDHDGTFVDGVYEGLCKAVEIYKKTRKKCKMTYLPTTKLDHPVHIALFSKCSLCGGTSIKDKYCSHCGAEVKG
jgi:hypothetical protein